MRFDGNILQCVASRISEHNSYTEFLSEMSNLDFYTISFKMQLVSSQPCIYMLPSQQIPWPRVKSWELKTVLWGLRHITYHPSCSHGPEQEEVVGEQRPKRDVVSASGYLDAS